MIKDYDCNYIKKQEKRDEWSFKELDTDVVKIDAVELRKEYLREKPELENTDLSSFEIK